MNDIKNLKIEVLEDVSSSGRHHPWSEKKSKNEVLEGIYRSLSKFNGDYYYNKAERLKECANFLLFDKLKNNSLKLNSMNSCKVRLCPVCSWRRSLKIYSHAIKIFSYIETDAEYQRNYSYLFLTLTVPNCSGDNLSSTIDLLMNAWKYLIERKEIKNIVKGWYRGLEITHNINKSSKSYNTYHPHFHCILVVDKSYLEQRKAERGYITQKQWKMLWAESLRYFVPKKQGKLQRHKRKKLGVVTGKRSLTLNEQKELIKEYSSRDYLCKAEKENLINGIVKKKKLVVKNSLHPSDWLVYHSYDSLMLVTAKRLMLQVDIRTVKTKGTNGLVNAVCEVTKYTVKENDYIIPYDWKLSQTAVSVLDDALANRRLVAWGGLLKNIHKKLNLDDEIDGDLINVDNDKSEDVESNNQVLAFWHTGYQQYVIKSNGLLFDAST